MKIYGKIAKNMFFVYGSWEALDSLKILPRGVGTFRPPGKPLPRTFQKSLFVVYFLKKMLYFPKTQKVAVFSQKPHKVAIFSKNPKSENRALILHISDFQRASYPPKRAQPPLAFE